VARGRFGWLPGGMATAGLLVFGFLSAFCALLLFAFDRELVWPKVLPFVMLAGCFSVTGGLPMAVAGRAILVLSAIGGYGVLGTAVVSHVRADMAAAEEQIARERAEAETRSAEALREYRAMAADAPLIEFLNRAFLENEQVQREVRERIANWPNRDAAIAAILEDEHNSYTDLAVTFSYIAWVHPAPPASLAPAYARAMDRSYTYWDYTVRNSYYSSKYAPEMETVVEGARRIQQAGGDLRQQLAAWRDLLRRAR
jgi:hypothetical protein